MGKRILVHIRNRSKTCRGRYFPDLFKWDGLNGYLGAMIVTGILASIVVWLSMKYEEVKKADGNFKGVGSEIEQYKHTEEEYKPFVFFSEETYRKKFL